MYGTAREPVRGGPTPVKLGASGMVEKGIGDGSGASAKSAKSGGGLISSTSIQMAAWKLTRITRGNWRRRWLRASKDITEHLRHLLLRTVHSVNG